MIRLVRFGASMAVILALVFVIVSAGCPGPKKTGTAGDEKPATADTQQTTGNGTTETQGQQKMDELFGNREPVTEEQLAAITAFGVFRYPDSVLIPGGSAHQQFPGDVEVYKLVFGVDAASTDVVDWYKKNLESGVQETTMPFPDGSEKHGFQYEPADGSWRKTITISGIPGDKKTQIAVDLFRRLSKPEEDKEESKEGGG